ncbi:MAG TPA: hypothetical protein VGW75_09410 [Solirubrobacteraceae bacterium]|jgi:hypothetical protein|nr:hypothetical protein [Solirubrobacteraceae bacterium]
MDPITGVVIAAITAYVTRKCEDAVETAGDALLEPARSFFERLKSRWADDAAASGDLERFADSPSLYAPVIQRRLEDELARDAELRAELQREVDELGPNVEVFQRIADARGVTGLRADEVTRGRARVEQQIERGENVLGADINKLG